jgi:hypothetical protein
MSRNDYLILDKKCLKYYSYLRQSYSFDDQHLSDSQKARLGFYVYILEHYTREKDVSVLVSMISDTDFNKIVFGRNEKDYGIDAIYIDEEEREIKLFNFAYRETYKPEQSQSEKKVLDSAAFFSAVTSEDLDRLSGQLKTNAQAIVEKLSERQAWNINLYNVSNEDKPVNPDFIGFDMFKNQFDSEVICVALPEIKQIMSIRPRPIRAKLVVSKDDLLSFSEDSMSTKKSYVFSLKVDELIRITCNNDVFRQQTVLDDRSQLATVDLDYSVLFDNVRGLVVGSKYNSKIKHTLRNDPSKFFLYNNGLTLTATSIECVPINAHRSYELTIDSLQVLNGGQTLRTIHSFNREDHTNIETFLSKASVLLRIFPVNAEDETSNKVAEYTNSQNSISIIELKSMRSEQIQIEQFLDSHNIIYSRKTGDTGISDNRNYEYKITMEKFGQILFAIKGFPYNVSNRKKDIFDETKYYDQLFLNPQVIERSIEYVKKYKEVKDIYRASSLLEDLESKAFYIMYILFNTAKTLEVSEVIDKFENFLSKYGSSSTSTAARNLLRIDFKEKLDAEEFFGLKPVDTEIIKG